MALGDKIIFNGSLTGQDATVDIPDLVPVDFYGPLAFTVQMHQGGSLALNALHTNNQLSIRNSRYSSQILSRFRSAVTWQEKAEIFAQHSHFSADQLSLLQSENSQDWPAQQQLLIDSGWAYQVVDSNRWPAIAVTNVRYNSDVIQKPSHLAADNNSLSQYVLGPGGVLSCDLIFNQVNLLASGTFLVPKILVAMLRTQTFKNNPKIIDLGVGHGAVWSELQEQGISGQIHGLDITKKERFSADDFYHDFIIADITQALPLPTHCYDVAVCSGVLGHGGKASIGPRNPDEIPADQYRRDYPVQVTADCLEEILRILQPGGLFVFSVAREAWHDFDHKLNQLENSAQIKILTRRWAYSTEEYHMFPPRHMCVVVEKSNNPG
jgi:SAM-dependent methyltransferase